MSMNFGDPKDKLAAMTFQEIGKRLGMSHMAAYTHFSRGMEKLRKHPEIHKCQELAELLDRQRKEYEW